MLDFRISSINSALRKVLIRLHYPLEVMLTCVRLSWRMDETYIKVAGQWKYLYGAVDRAGDTVDFLLTAKRDLPAARRFLERAINPHDLPEKITIDNSGANTAAIESVKTDACIDILMRWA